MEAPIETLALQPIERLSDAELGGELVALRRAIDRLEAEFVRRLQAFDRRGAYRADGSTSAVAWLKNRCGLGGGAAATRVEIARELDAVPGAVASFRNGDISFSNAAVLSRTASEVGPRAASLAGEMLMHAARTQQPEGCRAIARQLRHTVDPQGELAQALRDHRRRRFSLSQGLDGMFVCEGLLDAEGGAALDTVLQALDPPRPGDERTGRQRRADALVELATRQLQSAALPGCKGQRPHMTLTASIESLRGRRGERAAELKHAGAVNTQAARRIACDVVSFLDARSGQPLAASKRTVPPSMRRALAARDRGCRFPGCDRPESWCDAHHIVHWVDHGETSLSNLVLLCRIHHRFVHDEGWTLSGRDGDIEVRPPPRPG